MMKESNYLKIIKQICEKNNIELETFSDNWILKLKKNNQCKYIIGYKFGLNVDSNSGICNDKNAISEILTSFNIPNVKHEIFMSDKYYNFVSKEENLKKMYKLLEENNELVCKPNEGTGGNFVFHVTNKEQLKNISNDILSRYRSMAISKYIEIKEEYRLVMLNKKVKLIYSKVRPYIIGNGKDTIQELYNRYIIEKNLLEKNCIKREDRNKILMPYEKYNLEWRHNLGNGSKSNLDITEDIKNDLIKIATEVCNVLDINFASVDIISDGKNYKILEINSGVMMEYFSRESESNYLIAKEIYEEAILELFKNK